MAFSQSVGGLVNSGRMPREPNWFPYSKAGYGNLKGFMDFLFGAGSPLARGKRNRLALQDFSEYAALDLAQRWHNFKLSLPWNRDC